MEDKFMNERQIIKKFNELAEKKKAYIEEMNPIGQIEANKQIRSLLQQVKQTPEICLAAVRADGWAIMYVAEQTNEIALVAVKENGLALEYVNNKTYECCLSAVKETGHAIKYVPEPSEEIWLEAINSRPEAILYNKNPTKEMCRTAIIGDWNLLYDLPVQYPEICVFAANINENALDCIRKWTPEIEQAFVNDGWEIVSTTKNEKIDLEEKILTIRKGMDNKNVPYQNVNKEYCK